VGFAEALGDDAVGVLLVGPTVVEEATETLSVRSRRSVRASLSPWAMRRPWARMMRVAMAA